MSVVLRTVFTVVLENGSSFGGYVVQSLLGSGGMGDVYLVQNTGLDRLEALKVLRAQLGADDDYRERFMREIKLAAKLRHPNIVQVHHCGDHDGQLWMSMDYIDGADCTELLKEHGTNGLAPIEVLQIVSAIADALDYSHGQGLLHRDVKPGNILVTTDARIGRRSVFLADFGIARPLDGLLSNLTATNMVLGTVGYAAPEQITGQGLDGRTDQYALAATAFQLLTGSAIMSNLSLPMLIQRVQTPAPKLSDIKPELAPYDAAMARALAIDPADRFSTCRQFADALAGDTDTQLRPGYAPTAMARTQLNPTKQRTSGTPSMPVGSAAPHAAPSYGSSTARSGSHTALVAAILGGALILGGLVMGAAWLMRQSNAGQTSQAIESGQTVPSVTDVVSVSPTPSQAPYRAPSSLPEAPTMLLPDADVHGFTSYSGQARCLPKERAEFILRTTESAVVICRSTTGSLSYRGLRFSDKAPIWLTNVRVDGGGWLVTNNATEATYYYVVNSAGLRIFKENTPIGDEPAVESATP